LQAVTRADIDELDAGGEFHGVSIPDQD
jgi:hypothetical protein